MLDAAAVQGWCRDALAALGRAREEIDALNVYPVPDGDTGTNLYLTMEAALDQLDQLDQRERLDQLDAAGDDGGLSAAVRAVTRGALIGAHGNSGAILSELLRGAGDAMVAGPRPLDGARALAHALTAAADAAYAAVAHPVEGTMLSVMRAAADSAEALVAEAAATGKEAGLSAAAVVRAAADAANAALAATPQQLAVLARAGVVDAGGRGLTVLFEALSRSVSGRRPMTEPGAVPLPRPTPAFATGGDDFEGPSFEVMYLLEADEPATRILRAELEPLGDSLLVVGGEGLWNVHVHVDDPGAAVEAGIRAGRPYRITVTHLGASADRDHRAGDRARVVIAFTPGPGLARLATESGAVVLPGGSSRRTSSRELLAAIRDARAREVVFLPDEVESGPVAEAAAHAARAEGLQVAVLPTRAAVQVLAALAVHDPGRRFEDDVVSMTAAARATRTGSITFATSEALTSAGVCRPGDVLGIIDDDVADIGDGVEIVAQRVLDKMLSAGGELVTLVLGAGTDDQLASTLHTYLRHAHPGVDVTVHRGDQEQCPLLIGVE
jgi:uncharacterized protein